ncbi:MAG TPA: hypothetical protein VD905_07955 [Flavobacteriales bacterium]|nr:hypothetical protein [Flavobacteriales bacterium]
MKRLASKLPVDRWKSIKRKVMGRLHEEINDHMNDYRSRKKDAKSGRYIQALTKETNSNMVSSVHDAIANLLLYTEVLATDKPNVIVAYGAEHLGPLRNLVGETPARQKEEIRKINDSLLRQPK